MKNIKKISFIVLILALSLLIIGYDLKHRQKKVSTESIDASIDLGVVFLKSGIDQGNISLACKSNDDSLCPIDGRGFPFAVFFIGDAISSELSPEEVDFILSQLVTEERNGLWGYSLEAPVDSDDTAFALQTFKKMGAPKSIEKIFDFYKEREKGFTTFKSNVSAELVFQSSEKNNLHVHPEVNANIYNLLYDSPYANYINYDMVITSQAPEGYWYSYFYPSIYYSTYQNLKLLSLSGEYKDITEKAVNFLLNSQNNDGSWGKPGNAFDTSLALKSLASLNISNEEFWKGIEFLLNSQNKNGSWKNPTVIWNYIFRQNPLIIWQAFDNNMIISTAVSISALKDAKKFRIP